MMIEGRTAHGSKQHRLRGEAGLNGGVRQGVAKLYQGNAADFFFVEFEIVAKTVSYFFQHTNGLGGNFRTNSVAGEGGDAELHKVLDSFPKGCVRKNK
jgi:hypothetical protein